MAFWMRDNEVEGKFNEFRKDIAQRAKEIVDVGLALYLLGVEATIEDVEKHIKAKIDNNDRVVYFYFLSDQVKGKFLQVREMKVNNQPISVSDYYKCSHFISILKTLIKIEKYRIRN